MWYRDSITPLRASAKRRDARNNIMKLRRIMLWIHGWIGITVGAWLAVVGLTGSVLVWRTEVQPQLQARLMVMQPHAGKVSLQAVYDAVEKSHPSQKIDRIYPPRAPNLPYQVRLPVEQSTIFVNPYSGQIVGEVAHTRSFYDWVDELHVRLLADDVGHFLVGIGGFALFTMALSGLWLWWPRRGVWRRAFVPQLATNWCGRNYELHRVTGVFVCIFLMMNAVTGIAMVWSQQASQVLGWVLPARKDAKLAKAKPGKWLPLDDLTARADAALPSGEISRITWPKKKGAPLVIRMQLPGELNPAGNSSVALDPTSGRVLKIENSRDADALTRALDLRYPIHTGEWGGIFTKILYTLLGLTLPAFYVSGLVLWFFKFQKKRRSHRKLSVPKTVSV